MFSVVKIWDCGGLSDYHYWAVHYYCKTDWLSAGHKAQVTKQGLWKKLD